VPSKGETRIVDGRAEVWNGTEWRKGSARSASPAPSSGAYQPSTSSAPKVKTEGTSGLEETQSKSLSQILKEREEKRKKAAMIREGGEKK
jgi:hypothetical protein